MNEQQTLVFMKSLNLRLANNNPNNVKLIQFKTQIKFCLPDGKIWNPIVNVDLKELDRDEAYFYLSGVLRVMDGPHVEKVAITVDDGDTGKEVVKKIKDALKQPQTVTREEAAAMNPELTAEELAAFLPDFQNAQQADEEPVPW